MESESRGFSSVFHRVLPTVGPLVLVGISYVDPGKWAAIIEGGARFGGNLLTPLVYFNLLAVFCHYLVARISLITGKDLAQICCEEYDKWTCLFLGVQAMISVIALDLTMILGIAHGLHLLFGVDLSTCLFLTVADALSFHLFCCFFEKHREKGYIPLVASGLLAVCFLGALASQPEATFSVTGILGRLNEESAYALMSLVGSSIVPHNLYLHSAMVTKARAQGVPLDASIHHDLTVIVGVFGCVCTVYCILMNSASNVFYNTGLVLLTFPDAMSMMEILRGPIVPFLSISAVYAISQIIALTWNEHGYGVVHGFLGLDIPSWLQRATIRILAVVPALFCVWTSGIEGLYQLMVFAQVIVAVMLPCPLVPLFRVASSRSLMGGYKISQVLEFIEIVAFMGLLGLKIIFVVELIFGDCEWINDLYWSMGSFSSAPYAFLLITSCSSLCFVLWLAATPLKSATRLDPQSWTWDAQKTEEHLARTADVPVPVQVSSPAPPESSQLPRADPPFETIVPKVPLPVVEDIKVERVVEPVSLKEEDDVAMWDSEDVFGGGTNDGPPSYSSISGRTEDGPPSYSSISGRTDDGPPSYSSIGGRTDDGPPSYSSIGGRTEDGPPSYSSIGGRTEDGPPSYDCGGSIGSLSKLAGLGRAARRQMASILDEFWGKLYDLHGQPSAEAKSRKLEILLSDPRTISSPPKAENPRKQLPYNLESYRTPMQLLDAYVQGSSRTGLGVMPGSGWDNQPYTVHGYQIASIANRIAQEMSSTQGFPGRNYGDSNAYLTGQQMRSDVKFLQPSPYSCLAVPRNRGLPQSDRLPYDASFSPRAVESDAMFGCGSKKYCSMPDISGIAGAYKDVHIAENGAQWENPPALRSALGNSTLYSPALGAMRSDFDRHSQRYGEGDLSFGFTQDPGSIWSKQPFENVRAPPSIAMSPGDSESALLQSLRFCILKLLKLEGSEWLFRKNDGTDEDLIDRVAAREKCWYEAETREVTRNIQTNEIQYPFTDRKPPINDEAVLANVLVSSIPHCGDGCVWRVELIVSFGVWCIHRILDLSLMESRPELWGKYTFVLNRLQGIIDPAFSKARSPKPPCFCLQLSATHPNQLQRSSPPSNGMLPPASKPARGKCTTATSLLDLIKDVEMAVSCRKGRSGTAAGDVAYPKGKENLVSVLKRYKRRLGNKSGVVN